MLLVVNPNLGQGLFVFFGNYWDDPPSLAYEGPSCRRGSGFKFVRFLTDRQVSFPHSADFCVVCA